MSRYAIADKIGEIYMCNNETDGAPIILENFKGVRIQKICGGCKRSFIIEEEGDTKGRITNLHPPEYDEYDFTFTEKNLHLFHDMQKKLIYDEEGDDNLNRSNKLQEFGAQKSMIESQGSDKEVHDLARKRQFMNNGLNLDGQNPDDCDHMRQSGEVQDEAQNKTDENSEIREERENMQALYSAFDNKGTIVEVVSGKNHLIIQNDAGELYSYGFGEYGILGRGGNVYSPTPQYISILHNRKIVKVAAGYYHTLALTDQGDIYSWGQGFVGQLGIRPSVECASFPMLLPYFHRNFVTNIECGAYHSLAVDNKGNLYGWGESRCGQLGLGRKIKEPVPKQIPIKESVVKAAAGYQHTLVLTENGDIYSFGLNNKGQLGLGVCKSVYTPTLVDKDYFQQPLPKFEMLCCGHYNNFALSEDGTVYSWGSGILGFKGVYELTQPRKVETHLEDRTITDIFANEACAIFFCPVKITSMRPQSGPSSGGTIFSIIGTGLCDYAGKQKIKFIYSNGKTEFTPTVGQKYDENTNSFHCQTPNFEAMTVYDGMEWPAEAKVFVTLDGERWIDCQLSFFIYSSKVRVTGLTPKISSVNGGIELCVETNADNKTLSYFKNVCVGFQAVSPLGEDIDPEASDNESVSSQKNKGLNPLDLTIGDPELEKSNWVCLDGEIKLNKISLTIPPASFLWAQRPNVPDPLSNEDKNSEKETLFYNIDVSLNSQQFLGTPSSFRYYDLSVEKIEPNNSAIGGSTCITIMGIGFIDSVAKKIKLQNSFGERLIDVKWDKEKRHFFFYTPPISWLCGNNEDPEIEEKLRNEKVTIWLTVSGLEWFKVGEYFYYEPTIEEILPGPDFTDKVHHGEAALANWQNEEPYVDPLIGVPEKEIDKKKIEIEKHHKDGLTEIEEVFRKPGQALYIHGKDFLKVDTIQARCTYQQEGVQDSLSYPCENAVFKNEEKLGIIVPEIEGPPAGVIDITIQLSFNSGQQFSGSHKIKYQCHDADTPADQRQKIEDEELKKCKATKGKK